MSPYRLFRRTVKRILKHTPLYAKIQPKFALKRRRQRIEWVNKYKNELEFDDKTIVFISFLGKYYSDSPKAIYEKMIQDPKFDDYKFFWVFKNVEKAEEIKDVVSRSTIVKYLSEDYFKALYSAKYWITNNRMTDYVDKNEGQYYIQTWHGTPFKRIGFDIEVEGKNANFEKNELLQLYENDAKKYDLMPSPSKYYTQHISTAFNLKAIGKENIVKEVGYPRNDFLYNYTETNISDVKTVLGIPSDKKVILYAPTWRDNQHEIGEGYFFESPLDFDKLQQQIGDEYVFIYRPHYFIANCFDFEQYPGFVYDGTAINDINSLYIISDILITDYSSVFFDYANLRRKILFYMYDFEFYKDTLRGFYFDINELPGPISKTQEELVKDIKTPIDTVKVEKFANKYSTFDDGNAAQRVIDIAFNHQNFQNQD